MQAAFDIDEIQNVWFNFPVGSKPISATEGLTPFYPGLRPEGGESHAESSLVDFRRLHRGLCAAGNAL